MPYDNPGHNTNKRKMTKKILKTMREDGPFEAPEEMDEGIKEKQKKNEDKLLKKFRDQSR